MPLGAEIVTVGLQGDSMYLWALVDPDEKREEVIKIKVIGTGHDFEPSGLKYLGTAFQGAWVWHVYEDTR